MVDLIVRRRDHPEILDWCCSQISAHLSKHRVLAANQYPDHEILSGPEPTASMLEARSAPAEELREAEGG